jgi:hypothetical protein
MLGENSSGIQSFRNGTFLTEDLDLLIGFYASLWEWKLGKLFIIYPEIYWTQY